LFQHYGASIVDEVPGFGTRELVVPCAPVKAITSIELEDASLAGSYSTVPSSSYKISRQDDDTILRYGGVWSWTTLYGGSQYDPMAGQEAALYRVTYAGGYVTPTQATGELVRDLPVDLEQACLDVAVEIYQSAGRDRSVRSEKLFDGSITYFGSSEPLRTLGVPLAVALSPYTRRAIA